MEQIRLIEVNDQTISLSFYQKKKNFFLDNSYNEFHKNNTNDTLNAMMIDHLTNDIRTYEQVCLNVGDIQELRLIQLPSTFHESKAKLRAIDPCLVDIRLSPSDEYDARSNGSSKDQPIRAPIARQKRGESFGSNGGSALISSSSNESSSSFGLRPGEKFANESNDESFDEQIEKFRQLTTNYDQKPATLLAKKILPKKLERRPDGPMPSTINTHNQLRPTFSDQREMVHASSRVPHKGAMIHPNRTLSPLRVTITSKLNPNAQPFFIQQRNVPAVQNPAITFYGQARFRPRLPPVVSPDRSHSVPYGMHVMNNPQQPQPYPQYHQRFVPPRQMANKKNFTPPNSSRTNTRSNRTQGPPLMKYRLQQTSSLDKRVYPQQQHNNRITPNGQLPGNSDLIHSFNRHCFTLGFMRQTSLPMANQMVPVRPMQPEFPTTRNNPTRRSTASIRSTYSLPFQVAGSNDRSQMQTPVSLVESASSHRGPRTFSGASSSSSLSLDVRPHSINQFDSSSNNQSSFEAQYDFEKANEEFRRYLELEELVARCPSTTDGNAVQQSPSQSQANSYKKGVSFFDRISCTATTGTAVGYTEMDETEKNLQTFGDDALLLPPSSSDDEWQF
jgi:hypothetical protein